MKILLIYPYFLEERTQGEEIRTMPIGLYYVAAVLKENGYDVDILNWHDVHKTPTIIETTLREKNPQIIGFSILNANRWGAIEIARIAKRLDPNVTIVFGGIGATFLWEHFLRHFPEIDFIVRSEGEYTFLSLVRALEQANGPSMNTISGIAFRSKWEIVKTRDSEMISDLDQLPIPAKYFDYQQISSSRGCGMRCTFCGSPEFWGRKIRFRSPESVVEELEILYNKGIHFFYFSDDTFTINKERVIEICKKIIDRNMAIEWYSIARVDQVDEKILYWMRKAGCIQISFGVESGSNEIRAFLNKRISTSQIKKAFELTVSHGILARAYFIYGSPGETWETIQKTIDLIHQIKPLSIIFYILDIFPGTALYADFKHRLNLTDDIWLKKIEDIMYNETDTALTENMMLAFGKKLRSDFYENVHSFVDAIHLVDKKDLYKMHSDFCSRLGMTFSHGEYSKIAAIKEKDETAERLYRKALHYYPNHRAYLGLGMIKQKKLEFHESIEILSQGLKHFSDSEDLNLCIGISYMNIGDYQKALSYLHTVQDSRRANPYIAECYDKLGG
jgi:anaerobic magnesium-protoporphyrin IX monomethyl ester cyclase